MKQERMCLSTFSRSILFHMVQFPMRPKKPPDIATRGIQVIHAAITSLAVKAFTQFLLSSRLYCRFWNFTKSAAQRRSRTIPPVGNFTPPRRTIFICSLTEYHILLHTAIFFILSGNVHKTVRPPCHRGDPPSRRLSRAGNLFS